MSSNITPNSFSSRKSNSIPILIVHLEMQFLLGICQNYINQRKYDSLVHQYEIYIDRGKLSTIKITVSFTVDRGKLSTIKLSVTWSTTKILKFNIYLNTLHSNKIMTNSKMTSMFTYADATKTKSQTGSKSSEKKLGEATTN